MERPLEPPLPDPVAIRIRPVPDAAPPYDDQVTGEGPRAGHADVDTLAVAIMAALGRDDRHDGGASARGPRPAGALRRPAGAHGPSGAAGRSPGGNARTGPGRRVAAGERSGREPRDGRAGSSGPGPRDGWSGAEWPSRFAQLLAETLAGSRPPAQLAPWTTERARSHIRRLGPLLMAGQRPVVRRVVSSRPAPDVMEIAVVAGFGLRIRALAIRLEREGPRSPAPGRPGRPARWVCTTVEAA